MQVSPAATLGLWELREAGAGWGLAGGWLGGWQGLAVGGTGCNLGLLMSSWGVCALRGWRRRTVVNDNKGVKNKCPEKC
ncbi:hypothetical protein E2C01_056011 [Portunus trituberculatus]|uniref:Uncharacterized protein n=1 Tax=Portunus trituberculatus TaxID=210409 RepID=A0A5B7GZ71_PORTR|nr:hypothetical protein [Portunus trituberculatus]